MVLALEKWSARFGLVFSEIDEAGTGIAREIMRLAGSIEKVECRGDKCVEAYFLPELNAFLTGFDIDIVYFDFLDELFDVESYVFLSRHKAEAGRKSLTVHHTGNPLSQATHGGKPLELSISNSHLSKKLFKTLWKEAEVAGLIGEFDVTLEATHHGPTNLARPLTFIEIGSTPIEWRDQRARKVIAKTVVEAIKDPPGRDYCIPVAGYGGGHYPVKHTKIHLEKEYCYGHILAKYAFSEGVKTEVILQTLRKNYPGPVELGIIEKKSLRSQYRKDLIKILEENGIEYMYV
jgi:D-aminoacyl-tRNA deacylase